MATAAEDRQAVVAARRSFGEALMEEGRFAEAEAELEIALRLSRELGEAFNRTEVLCALARIALARDDVDSAERFVTEAKEGVRTSDVIAVSLASQVLASVRAARHDDAAAEAGFREALATIATTEYRERWVDASIAYARFLAEKGRPAEAGGILRPIERWLGERGYRYREPQIAAIQSLIGGPPD
jgi:hypothetical protein